MDQQMDRMGFWLRCHIFHMCIKIYICVVSFLIHVQGYQRSGFFFGPG